MTRYDFCSKFNDDCLSIVIKNGKYGIYNFQTETEVIPPKYDNIQIMSKTCFKVKVDNHWGVVNNKNEIIADTIYEEENIYEFDEDYICVNSEKGVFLISKCGTYRSELYDIIYDFINGFAIVKRNSLYGVIDKKFIEIVSLIYDRLFYYKDDMFFAAFLGKFAIITPSEMVKRLEYHPVLRFHNSPYILVTDGSNFGVVDEELNFVIDIEYSEIDHCIDDYFVLRKNSVCSLFNVNKGIIIEGDFPLITYLDKINNQFFFKVIDKNDNHALFNDDGVQLTEFKYPNIINTFTNVFLFTMSKDFSKAKWGILNSEGKEIIKSIYDVLLPKGDFYISYKNDKYRILNSKGEKAIKTIFDRVFILGDYYVIFKNGKCGIYDKDFNRISDIIYDDVLSIVEYSRTGHRFAEVLYNGEKGNFYF